MNPIEHALNESFSGGNRFNEIIVTRLGNTYVGPLSQLFATGRLKLPKVFVLDSNTELFHVFQITDGGKVIQRAAVSSRLTADNYMAPDRVCVYRNATFVKHAKVSANLKP